MNPTYRTLHAPAVYATCRARTLNGINVSCIGNIMTFTAECGACSVAKQISRKVLAGTKTNITKYPYYNRDTMYVSSSSQR